MKKVNKTNLKQLEKEILKTRKNKQVRVNPLTPDYLVSASPDLVSRETLPLIAGLKTHVEVGEVPPPRDERMKKFAYMYAVEPHRSKSWWAKKLGVPQVRIDLWLKRPDVYNFIDYCRRNEQLYLIADRLQVSHKLHKKLNEVLNLPITDKNLGSISKVLCSLLPLYSDTVASNVMNAQTVNSITVNQNTSPSGSVKSEKTIEQIQKDLEELSLLKSHVPKTISGTVVE